MFGPKIRIDPELHRRAAEHAVRAGYASLEDLVAHLLERELRRGEKGPDEDEQAGMKDRLQGLGYIS